FVRRTRLARRLAKWRLEDFFRSKVSPEQASEFKPSPEPYLRAIADFQLRPHECVVVGDEPVDMMGGKRAGTKTIGLPLGFYSREELRDAGAEKIISSLNALPKILK
ncbi:MAG TPA: HAD-IA family hydrolase, partial [Candidatus Bathyarchaeia archaeon]|nr:HAD-IA family hydrolase [Candidatus Bathyarchaeia archaeon]